LNKLVLWVGNEAWEGNPKSKVVHQTTIMLRWAFKSGAFTKMLNNMSLYPQKIKNNNQHKRKSKSPSSKCLENLFDGGF
jgi:hypothetical protein